MAELPAPTPVPVFRLDPNAANHDREQRAMRDAGDVVRVELTDGVFAWAVTRYELLNQLLTDRRISKNYRDWTAIKTGAVTEAWPFWGMVAVDNMFTANGAEHRRLRRPVTSVFTRSRVEELRPRVEAVVAAALDALPDHADEHGVVDLQRHFAYAVPMRIICGLVGVPDDWRDLLRELVDSLFRTDASATAEATAVERERTQLLDHLLRLRRDERGEDLTSALITLTEQGTATLTDNEVRDTVWLLITAGHETTLILITNAVKALLLHPDQRDLAVRGGQEWWSAVVAETLRHAAPVGNFLCRYAREDITVGGVTIPAGDMIMSLFSGVGRDPAYYGPDADQFDITRPRSKHLAFGGGEHMCLGAHLAQLEATVALSELFTRFPDLRLAQDPATLRPRTSLFSNSVEHLPVVLGGDHRGATPAGGDAQTATEGQ